MIEMTVKIRIDNVDEMSKEVKGFLGTLREYCDVNIVAEAANEDVAIEDAGIGYRYDNGEPINNELLWLCKRCRVDDFRDVSVEELDLPPRVCRSLMLAGYASPPPLQKPIMTIGDLIYCDPIMLGSRRGFGQKALDEVKEVLKPYGLSLKK